MAFSDPLQWLIIGVIFLALFLWGPQKIPELARALGLAKREFDQASKEVTSFATTSQSNAKSSDTILLETATQLGISTQGKTREQISLEIIQKSKPQA